MLINSVLIPTTVELTLSSFMVLYMCGPLYFMNVALAVSAYVSLTKKLAKKRKKFIMNINQSDKQSNFAMNECLANYYNVKTFDSEKYELSKYTGIARIRINSAIMSMKYLAELNIKQRICVSLSVMVNLVMGAFGVANGTLTPGDLAFLQMLMVQIFGPLFNLGNIYRGWQESFVEINELLEMLNIKTKIVESPNAKELEYTKGNIRLENLDFSFESETSVS